MSFLLDETRRFCAVQFDVPEYSLLDRRAQKVRHIALHLMGIPEKLLIDLNMSSDQFKVKQISVAGDLGMYCSMLMDEFALDELQTIASPELNARDHLDLAFGGLKKYLEPLEHGGRPTTEEITDVAAPHLHTTKEILAARWRIDPVQAQLVRMHRPDLGLNFLPSASE